MFMNDGGLVPYSAMPVRYVLGPYPASDAGSTESKTKSMWDGQNPCAVQSIKVETKEI